MTPPSRRTGATPVAVAALALALFVAGCGGGGGGGGRAAQAFPSASGKATLRDLVRGLPQGPNLAPAVPSLDSGSARFAFGLFDSANRPINGAPVAVYVASEAQTDVRGPYPAQFSSLQVAPPFRSRTTENDPNSARGIYVAHVPVTGGKRVLIALVRLHGRLRATTAALATVDPPNQPPKVGERAIRVHTPTAASVHGDLSKIDTRVPPDDMHAVDLWNVLGRRPVMLVFATPALCQSRTCGPIVDEAAQVESQFRGRIDFVHMEVYRDNDFNKGYRPQLRAWRLQTEPWVFAIGRDGRVKARLAGPASPAELRDAALKALT